ncbi:MAG: antA/AntB antirepressor family protein [Anaerotignum sp.]|nr:antA/AntB antirepressor family protein [Anaerotignum sp.]
MNDLVMKEAQTPIEIALQVDSEGRTTARKLYEFLELNPVNYARWCKTNILENPFAEKDIDFYSSQKKSEGRGNFSEDYKLTASFAKKLAMGCQNKRGDEARIYFIAVEDKLKEIVTKGMAPRKEVPSKSQKKLASVNNAAKIILPQLVAAGVDPVQRTYFLKDMYAPVGINVPMVRVEQEKLYEQTEMAEILGVYSKSGKPYAQAIGAIMSKLNIAENDIVQTSFSRNGHTDISNQYREPVLHQVESWIMENGYPTVISSGSKNFGVDYR